MLYSGIKFIEGLAKSFEKYIEAILNAVSSRLSNGIVEGANSKLNMIERTKYDRCVSKLLAAKLMLKV